MIPFSAVLTGKGIAPEYFTACQSNLRARTIDHILQSDDGGLWKRAVDGLNYSSTILYH
jgi:ligand-binding sensor domain-containing protein